MARKWIKRAKLKRGTFTAQARRSGMGTQSYARKVLAGKPTKGTPSGDYTERTIRRARLARQFAGMAKKKKKR